MTTRERKFIMAKKKKIYLNMEPSHERVSCITEPGFWTQTASR